MTEQPSPVACTSTHFELQFRDKKLLGDMYLCVLVKGILPTGQPGYCYFGIFADAFVNFLNRLDLKKPFNPSQKKPPCWRCRETSRSFSPDRISPSASGAT